jgi:hypothetical protein
VSSPQRPPAAGGAAPADPPRASAQPPGIVRPPGIGALWKDKPDGRTVFRHPVPLVLWWAWAAFALINVGYLIADGLSISSARAIAALLVVTGIMYACTLHARVEADAGGVSIYNPVREHRVPWAVVEGIYLGESVEFACTRPGQAKPKTLYSWALYSTRKARARANAGRAGSGPGRSGFGASRSGFGAGRPGFGAGRTGFTAGRGGFGTAQRGVSSRAPAEAAELVRQQSSQLMVTELSRRAAEARDCDQAGGALRSTTSWPAIAAIVVPAILLLVAFMVR